MRIESRRLERLKIPIQYSPSESAEGEKRRGRKFRQIFSSDEKVDRIKDLELSDPSYVPDSSYERYCESGQGLGAYFWYILEGRLPKTLLEIGIGKGQAQRTIAQFPELKDVAHIGTSLVDRPEFHDMPENVNIKITPAETLEGIDDGSVGAILSFSAIGFSDHPEQVAESMDRVLARKGVIKATFRRKNGSYGLRWDRKYDEWGYHTHDKFTEELHKRGYDIAILETDEDDVVVAIKGQRTMPELLQQGTFDTWEWMSAWSILAADNMAYHWGVEPIEVFGKERLAQVGGNEATADDATRLIEAVKTVCTPDVSFAHHGTLSTGIKTGQNSVYASLNPKGIGGFGDNEADRGVASIQRYKVERGFRKPSGYRVPGKFKSIESIYVDRNGEVNILKTIYYDGKIKSRRQVALSAVKPATTQEVDEAIRILNESFATAA